MREQQGLYRSGQSQGLLFGGYGPAVVIAITLALLVWLVPSIAPEESEVLGTSEQRSSDPDTSSFSPGPSVSGPTGGAVPTTGGPVPTTNNAKNQTRNTTTNNNGSAGSGGAITGTGGESPAPASTGGAVATAGNCEGGARQTREPYSPPCITFSGSNGGATSSGVTGETVTVAFREGSLPSLYAVAGQVAEKANIKDTNEDIRRTIQTYFDYFNKKFQLYGRKVNVQFYTGQGDQLAEFFGAGVETANADALRVGQEIKAFADLSVLSTPYAEALVRQKVLAMPPVHMSRQWYAKQAPYAWGVLIDCTRLAESVVDYALKRLIGFKARYAGDPSYRTQDRKIGFIVPEEPWYQECANDGVNRLNAAGATFAHRINYKLDFTRLSSDSVGMVAQMKDKGVNSLICMCDPILPLFLTTQATQQQYRPEWVVVGTALTDVDLLGQIYDQEQWRHAFGISFLDDIFSNMNAEAYRTYKEIRSDEPAFIAPVLYYPILMFFLGVQMAGPNLNPNSFQEGLYRYPATGGETGVWSFGPGDHTGTNDAREMFFDPNSVSPFNGEKGRYVKTLGGQRFTDNWPAGEVQFPIDP